MNVKKEIKLINMYFNLNCKKLHLFSNIYLRTKVAFRGVRYTIPIVCQRTIVNANGIQWFLYTIHSWYVSRLRKCRNRGLHNFRDILDSPRIEGWYMWQIFLFLMHIVDFLQTDLCFNFTVLILTVFFMFFSFDNPFHTANVT